MRKLSTPILIAAISAACAAPFEPTPPPPPAAIAGVPTTVELSTVPSPGRATVRARVLDGSFHPIRDYAVTFESSRGVLTPAEARTDETGVATAIVEADAGPLTVIARVGILTREILIAMQPPIPGPPPPIPPPPEPPAEPLPPLTVTLLITPALAGSPTTFALATLAITRAVWTFGDGTSHTTTAPTTTHVYTAAGTYTARVTVTDMHGRSASDSQLVVIPALPPPPPPPPPRYAIHFTASPPTAKIGQLVILTARVLLLNGAPDVDRYEWDCESDGFIDATTRTRNSMACTYPTAGTHVARVTIYGGALVASASAVVTITP